MQVVKNQIKAFLEEFLDPNRIQKKGFPTMRGVGPVGPKLKPNPQSKFKVSNEFMAGMNVMLILAWRSVQKKTFAGVLPFEMQSATLVSMSLTATGTCVCGFPPMIQQIIADGVVL